MAKSNSLLQYLPPPLPLPTHTHTHTHTPRGTRMTSAHDLFARSAGLTLNHIQGTAQSMNNHYTLSGACDTLFLCPLSTTSHNTTCGVTGNPTYCPSCLLCHRMKWQPTIHTTSLWLSCTRQVQAKRFPGNLLRCRLPRVEQT